MKCYRKSPWVLTLLIALILSSCTSEEETIDTVFAVEVVNFQPTYDQVTINWSIEKSQDIAIQKIYLLRTTTDQTGVQDTRAIATLSAEATSYTDTDIPYYATIAYQVSYIYTITEDPTDTSFQDYLSLESSLQTYSRDIIFFDTVPFQVAKDPLNDNIFHLVDRLDIAELKRYNFNENTVTESASLSDNQEHNVVFQQVGNSIYIANDKGAFKVIDKTSYEITKQFTVDIQDQLKSFTVDQDRVYYHDNDILKYHDLSSEQSINTHWAYFPSKSMQTIAPNKILFESTSVVEISPTNCPDGSNCSPVTLYSYNNTSNQDLHIDPYLFSWNADNTKFVTSYHADIVNINDLTKEASLKDITGKNYFQVTFSPDGNLYATVQGEKLIHVFNNNYELIDTITTKLYPLFPLITDSGLQVIGAYNAIQYSGYYYGHEFNFNNNKCAIEVF